jgi:hypothetical protein
MYRQNGETKYCMLYWLGVFDGCMVAQVLILLWYILIWTQDDVHIDIFLPWKVNLFLFVYSQHCSYIKYEKKITTTFIVKYIRLWLRC